MAKDDLISRGEKLGEALQRETADRASQVAAEAGERAETAVAAVGCQMKDLAGRLREHAPHEGMIGTAAETVARTLESGGEYLEEHDLRAIADDVTGVVRNHPIPSVLICVGLGFLIGRTFRS